MTGNRIRLMASAFRHSMLARCGIAVVTVLATGAGLTYIRTLARWPARSTVSDTRTDPAASTGTRALSAEQRQATGDLWSVFRSAEPLSTGGTSGSQRFRFVGAFFVEDGVGGILGRAVIEAAGKREQFVVGEGGIVEEATVEKVFLDHVVLRLGASSMELWQEFATSPVTTGLVASASNALGVAAAGPATNKFGGVQVRDNRWEFRRKPLLDYYQELLEEPERMVAVFDSLKPVRSKDNKITGYVVGMEGEKDFFDAAGLRNGDVVRKVNSLDMTSRRRAEYFIDEFLKDRVNVIVLDVEREGRSSKLIYQVRP